jgi:hypothetical protein
MLLSDIPLTCGRQGFPLILGRTGLHGDPASTVLVLPAYSSVRPEGATRRQRYRL